MFLLVSVVQKVMSLLDVISNENYRLTTAGRNTWKFLNDDIFWRYIVVKEDLLISSSTFGREHLKMRIGLPVATNENDS